MKKILLLILSVFTLAQIQAHRITDDTLDYVRILSSIPLKLPHSKVSVLIFGNHTAIQDKGPNAYLGRMINEDYNMQYMSDLTDNGIYFVKNVHDIGVTHHEIIFPKTLISDAVKKNYRFYQGSDLRCMLFIFFDDDENLYQGFYYADRH